MAYMHGNLALQPKKRPEEEQQHSYREKKHVVVRRKSLPVQEKLLYLVTVLVCVIVSCVIIFRYAEVYQTNLQVQEMTSQYETLNVEIKEMQRKVEQLSSPDLIREKAMAQGMVQSDHRISLQVGETRSQMALKD
ncbi:cell division protein FtsL [Paenibacillus daejeonensis]|uniref:cell division protein FtsL n=1 Tax=Paenibacillus daejeonensis TaxID=135193 RepID=UPI00035C0D5B|nr:septum formation initiator family protein [Paenibacillus daejeonensis]